MPAGVSRSCQKTPYVPGAVRECRSFGEPLASHMNSSVARASTQLSSQQEALGTWLVCRSSMLLSRLNSICIPMPSSHSQGNSLELLVDFTSPPSDISLKIRRGATFSCCCSAVSSFEYASWLTKQELVPLFGQWL